MDDKDKNINPDENNEAENKKMTSEEYFAGENSGEEALPSSYLQLENQADEINMVIIPPYNPDIDAIISAYVDEAAKAKTKHDLFEIMAELFDEGEDHGARMERRDRLTQELARNDLIEGVESGKYQVVYRFPDEESEGGEL